MEEKTTLYKIHERSETTQHGLNERKIGFIVHKSHYQAHKELLHKIISAVGLDVEKDVLIVELENNKGRIIFKELNRKSSCKHYFVFGLESSQLSLQTDMVLHYPKITEDFIIHLSYSLEELANDLEKKKALWAYLKKIFK